jgi:hypothetical protein
MRRVLALSFSVMVSSMLFAAPVGAAAAKSAGSLGHDGCTDAAASARSAPTGRDGMVREPVLDQEFKDLPARAKGKAAALPEGFSATVEVYFHVVTSGGQGELTSKQIRDQISVLNTTFGGGEGGADTGFSFVLAGVTRTENQKWFVTHTGAEHDMKKTLKQGDDSDLNVYSTSGGGYLGWAYYPSITDTNQSYLDGVVLNWRTLPGASDAYAGRYDLGETLTHEVGHWLNLAHTFDGGCKEPGDFVADTPAMSVPTNGCPAGKDSCPDSPGLDPIHNYMDYSYDSCYTEFTPGQTARAQDAWLFYRAS